MPTSTESGHMACRPGCGACCIAITISSPIPGMPNGKPAGVPCPHLTEDYLCGLYGKPERPDVCKNLKAHPDMCGSNRAEALERIAELERATQPAENA